MCLISNNFSLQMKGSWYIKSIERLCTYFQEKITSKQFSYPFSFGLGQQPTKFPGSVLYSFMSLMSLFITSFLRNAFCSYALHSKLLSDFISYLRCILIFIKIQIIISVSFSFILYACTTQAKPILMYVIHCF